MNSFVSVFHLYMNICLHSVNLKILVYHYSVLSYSINNKCFISFFLAFGIFSLTFKTEGKLQILAVT
jgi:hypothetical protein